MHRVISAFFLLLTFCNAWIVDVERYSSECFFERVKDGVKLALTFEVIEGGFLDIDVEIKGPDDFTIYNGPRESSGKYTFAAYKEGKYQFCFNNHMSAIVKKRVMFDVLVGQTAISQSEDMGTVLKESNGPSVNRSKAQYSEEEEVPVNTNWPDSPSANHSARLQRMVEALSTELNGVAHEQRYLLARDILHLRLNEDTNAFVVRWAIFECIIIFVGSVSQIYYIKTYFEVRRIL